MDIQLSINIEQALLFETQTKGRKSFQQPEEIDAIQSQLETHLHFHQFN